jgi:hypothetical protein
MSQARVRCSRKAAVAVMPKQDRRTLALHVFSKSEQVLVRRSIINEHDAGAMRQAGVNRL